MATTPDFTILAAPRISPERFAAILRSAGSPAAPEAAAAYRAFTAAGVDPAVALALFRKESTYGRFGRAARNRSWGNIRGGTTYPLDDKAFRIYPSWAAGAQDAARLLAIYGANRIRPGIRTDTVQTFPYVWAPSGDGNAPDRYGDQLAGWIAAWSGQPGAGGGAPGSSSSSSSATSPAPAATAGVVLAVFSGQLASTCSQVTLIAPGPLGKNQSAVPIPKESIGDPCTECAPGYVPGVVGGQAIGPVTGPVPFGFVDPATIPPGVANACIRSDLKVGDSVAGSNAAGVAGDIAGAVTSGILAGLGPALTPLLYLGVILALVAAGLYLLATSEG